MYVHVITYLWFLFVLYIPYSVEYIVDIKKALIQSSPKSWYIANN